MSRTEAPAKINLCLHVGPRREDGYHPICSLMEKVTLFDSLEAVPSAGEIEVRGMDIPPDQNLVTRAVKALARETGTQLGVTIELTKQIPLAAGLAGGSSDAATALRLVASMFELQVSEGRLAEIARSLGADVPFFLSAGAQLAEGLGEVLQPVSGLPKYYIVLVTPEVEVSTAEVYRLFDAGERNSEPFYDKTAMVQRALQGEKNMDTLLPLLENDLETAASSLCPDIPRLRRELLSEGAAGSLMSGSGPSVFGIFKGKQDAEAAAAKLRGQWRRVWLVEPLR